MKKIVFWLLTATILLAACNGSKTASNTQVSNLKFNAGRNKDFHVTIVNEGHYSKEKVEEIKRIYSVAILKVEKELKGEEMRKELLIALSKNNKFTSMNYHCVLGYIQLYDLNENQFPYYYTALRAVFGFQQYSGRGEFLTDGLASYFEEKYGPRIEKNPNTLTKFYEQKQITLPIMNLLNSKEYMDLMQYQSTGDDDADWVHNFTRWVTGNESESFSSYLIKTYGKNKYMALFKEQDLTSAIPTIYGKNIEDLEQDWKNDLMNNPKIIEISKKTIKQEVQLINDYKDLKVERSGSK